MKNFKKSLSIVCLFLAVSAEFSVIQASAASSPEMTVQDKAISAFTNVMGLDLEKYKVDLVGNSTSYLDNYGGLASQYLTYNIEAARSKGQIGCTFLNKTLTRCYVSAFEGSLLYAQPLSSDILAATKTLLQRYQAYSGLNLEDPLMVLDTVSEVKAMNVTAGNMKLKIVETGVFVDFTWLKVINGVDFPYGLSVNFQNGELKSFSDKSRLYKIGSSNLNISREQAIQITKNQAKNYTDIEVPNGDGTFTQVQLNLTDEHIVVELQPANREPLTLYPLWYVKLYADKPYGGIYGFQAGIWADTGEVAYAQLVSYHGEIGDSGSPDQSSTQQQPQNNSTDSSPIYLIAGIAMTAIALGSAFAIFKRRRK